MAKKKFVCNFSQIVAGKPMAKGAAFTADDEDKEIKYALARGRIAPDEKKSDEKGGKGKK